MSVLKMAWRNVWRNKRRSLVTIAAMTLALLAELLYAGLITGMLEGMEDDVIEMEVGDVQVFSEAYRERPSIFEHMEDADRIVTELDAQGYAATPRLLGGGLAAAGELSSGVMLRGLDVDRDAEVLRVHEAVRKGSWLDPADPLGVVLGYRLARTLAVDVGDEVVVLTQAADGSMANELLSVRGILGSVGGGSDRSAIYMVEDTFRTLMAVPEGAHQIIVRRSDGGSLEEATAAVREVAPDKDVQNWREIMPIVSQMMESTGGVIYFMYFIVYVAVAILILNAMLMAVFERVREFGVLKAIGMGPGKVMSLILVESMLQAGIALVAGVLIAAPGMWYLQVHGIDVGSLGGVEMMGMSMPPVWMGIYDAETLVGPIVMLFVIVFLAVLYPAAKAAWIRPVEAIQHQ